MPIRVILVDDHALVREGVARLLASQPDVEVSASFADGREAIRYAAEHSPDVAVLDVAMPRMNGIELAQQLRDASPGTQILMLSMHSDPEYVVRALQAGAQGYVVKDSAGRVLLDAVRAVHAGRRYLCAHIDQLRVEERLRDRGLEDPIGRLSTREREVLQLTVEGMSIAEIAALLHLSPRSVETYRSRLMAKLEIENMPALVKFAIRHGITKVE